MGNIEVAVLSSDIGIVSSALSDNNLISYVSKENINDIENSINNEEVFYAIIPYNMNVDLILRKDLHILYHLTDIGKKYVLTVENKTFYNIMRKFYTGFKKEDQNTFYKNSFLDEYFYDKEISDAERMGYNSMPYNVGYMTYMPFEGIENKNVIGTLSNYFSDFEDIYDVDFNFIYYDNIEKLKWRT